MAAPQRGLSVDKNEEWEDFINKLKEFHENRGTNFESEPKVGQKRVDLLQLYKRVVADGGYDRVSDTKQMPLQWKTIGHDLALDKATHASALAFVIKTAYYRNLAAYEITHVHHKVPPPKEILEDLSAKGGGLLNRTMDNFPQTKKGEDEEGEETANADKMEVDEPGSGRAMRAGLRQAPPQRQLFQADPATTYRQGRHQGGQQSSSPNPSYGGLGNLHNATAAQALANYEPRPAFPLTLRPVMTPASNPDQFKAHQANVRDAHLARLSGRPAPPPKSNIMLPGTGFPGPNIYVRTWMALKSEVLEEQEYALHHLVKISHERGDKYRFDQFGGLMEALVNKLLETSSFFYDADWKPSFDQDEQSLNLAVLDALRGTPDLLARLRRAKRRRARDKVETDDATQRLRLISEAGLVVRNLVMLDENAEYVLKYPPTIDALTIVLNLPDDPSIIEVKHYALEIVEQVAKFMPPDRNDTLLTTIMTVACSSDRGVILTSLRAISRIGTRLDHVTPLPPCPLQVVHRLNEWLLIEDQDLRSAVLDVLYRYTATVGNIETMLRQLDVESLVRQLARLLQYGARHEETQEILRTSQPLPPPQEPHPAPPSDQQIIPRISSDHVDMLLNYEEPERSSQWLRACFYEDVTGEITQIALWQAYQIPFTPHSSSRPLLPAKDFITNVSTTFAHATAQVINGDQPKFIIKGIRPREIPVDPKGKPFMRCHWVLEEDQADTETKAGDECPEFATTASKMWEHVINMHLKIPKNDDGKFDPSAVSAERKATCGWSGCTRFRQDQPSSGPASASPVFEVGMHIKTHLPDTSNMHSQRSKHNVTSLKPQPGRKSQNAPSTRSWSSDTTMHDEKFEATGLPLTACLVLRNLARNIPKTPFAQERREAQGSVVQPLFAPVMPYLYRVLAYNRALADYLSVLLRLVESDS